MILPLRFLGDHFFAFFAFLDFGLDAICAGSLVGRLRLLASAVAFAEAVLGESIGGLADI